MLTYIICVVGYIAYRCLETHREYKRQETQIKRYWSRQCDNWDAEKRRYSKLHRECKTVFDKE